MPATNTPDFCWILSAARAYAPAILIALFFNVADIWFLQTERTPPPPIHRSPTFWIYLIAQVGLAAFAAHLLFLKAGLTDPFIVGFSAGVTAFAVIQSFAFKIGDHGIDLSSMFDAWKRGVTEDISKANASRKRREQANVARDIATRAIGDLEAAIHLLAPSVGVNSAEVIASYKAQATVDPRLLMAQWLASTDLEFARSLKPKAST